MRKIKKIQIKENNVKTKNTLYMHSNISDGYLSSVLTAESITSDGFCRGDEISCEKKNAAK